MMRIHVHDFAGHPFQIELSRELARRGHDVTHSYGAQVITGRGRLELAVDDPPTLRIIPIVATAPMVRYALRGRVEFERSYARSWRRALQVEDLDVMICANTPLGVLAMTRRHLRTPWVLWHQDITSLAISDEAARRLPAAVAGPLGQVLQNTEKRLVASSSRVVAIGPQFLAQYRQWGLDTSHVDVIPNWAPLGEIRPGDRDNEWAAAHDLRPAQLRLVYAGTLGRKHNPQLLLDLLDRLRDAGTDASLVVLSEGDGADALAAPARPEVQVLPFQSPGDLPHALASGDVLVALLEPDAAQYSIPSKVLSYLAAGRPVLALAPRDNPCADDVIAAGGLVVEPSAAGIERALPWLQRLATDSDHAAGIGRVSRDLAEQKFDARAITDRFEALLLDAVDVSRRQVQIHGQIRTCSAERARGQDVLRGLSRKARPRLWRLPLSTGGSAAAGPAGTSRTPAPPDRQNRSTLTTPAPAQHDSSFSTAATGHVGTRFRWRRLTRWPRRSPSPSDF